MDQIKARALHRLFLKRMLQGNRGDTGKSCQNSRGTGIVKLAGAAPFMEASL